MLAFPAYPPSRTWWLWLEDLRWDLVDDLIRAHPLVSFKTTGGQWRRR